VQAISSNFIPVKVHIKEQKQTFERFGAQWTPTLIVLDPDGNERHRVEGFLPAGDFLAQLDMGRAKLAFQRQAFRDAETIFRSICQDRRGTFAAPEACYWAGVAAYKAGGDATRLNETARLLKKEFPESEWARKASVWL